MIVFRQIIINSVFDIFYRIDGKLYYFWAPTPENMSLGFVTK